MEDRSIQDSEITRIADSGMFNRSISVNDHRNASVCECPQGYGLAAMMAHSGKVTSNPVLQGVR